MMDTHSSEEQSNLLSVDIRISTALNENASELHFFDDQIKHSSYREGYIVQIDSAWYFLDIECDVRRTLPSFVRSLADAKAFITEAGRWYDEGFKNGRNAAKNELRKWLEPEC